MTNILFVGDIHLGRRPSGLPASLGEEGLDPGSLTPKAAWRSTVEWALQHDVDAVVLAGDVVDGYDDRFEACDRIEWGVRELGRAGIRVLAVAGNHDVRSLPRVADAVDGFQLLGKGGVWETEEIVGRDGGRVRILGWSFPNRVCRENPLQTLQWSHSDDVPTLGVLHCDLDKLNSEYAPVPRADLKRILTDGWFLGHIHAPSNLEGPRPMGYLGSLVGLDPGERGVHGPWLARIHGRGDVEVEQIPLAPLRYEAARIDLEGLVSEDADGVADAAMAAMREALRGVHLRCRAMLMDTRVVCCRLTLAGRTPHHHALRRWLAGSPDLPSPVHDDVRYFVEKIVDDGAQPLDLEGLARGRDPAALLAGKLLLLERGGDEAAMLVRAADRELDRRSMDSRWAQLDLAPPDHEEVRQHLLRAGRAALEDILAQRATAGEAS